MTATAGVFAASENGCFNVWDENNLGMEICYLFMSLLFVTQAIYAGIKRANIAIQFDVVMAFGCSISLGIWLGFDWLVQLEIAFMLLANFFIAYKLRDLQNIGTSWVFVLTYLSTLLVFTILAFSAAVEAECKNHVLQAVAYSGFLLCQFVTVIMLLTVRQNSLKNYARLPVWFLTIGSLF